MNIQYSVLDDDPDAETKFSIDTDWEPDCLDGCMGGWAAKECAEDYAAHHGGWEGWKEDEFREFALFREDGTAMGVWLVFKVMTPTYSVVRKEQEA